MLERVKVSTTVAELRIALRVELIALRGSEKGKVEGTIDPLTKKKNSFKKKMGNATSPDGLQAPKVSAAASEKEAEEVAEIGTFDGESHGSRNGYFPRGYMMRLQMNAYIESTDGDVDI
jgi:hypothetical protein